MYTKVITFKLSFFLEIRLVICGTSFSDHYALCYKNVPIFGIYEQVLVSVTLDFENSFKDLNFQFLTWRNSVCYAVVVVQTFPYRFSDYRLFFTLLAESSMSSARSNIWVAVNENILSSS